MLVEHGAGHVHVGERFTASELKTRHHHARYPEKNNVASRDQHGRRIEGFQVIRLIRPAERRKRPKRGREPGVEHVFVLRQFIRAGFFFGFCTRTRNDDLAVVRVPRGNLMAPPKLSRDGPITQILKPVRIDFFVRNFGNKLRLVIRAQLCQRRIAQLVHATEPLHRDQWLEHGLAAFAFRNCVFVIVNFLKQAERFEFLDHQIARFVPIESNEVCAGSFSHATELIDHRDLFEVVPQSRLVVVRIVRRRDFDGAGAEFGFDKIIGDDRNLAIHQR